MVSNVNHLADEPRNTALFAAANAHAGQLALFTQAISTFLSKGDDTLAAHEERIRQWCGDTDLAALLATSDALADRETADRCSGAHEDALRTRAERCQNTLKQLSLLLAAEDAAALPASDIRAIGEMADPLKAEAFCSLCFAAELASLRWLHTTLPEMTARDGEHRQSGMPDAKAVEEDHERRHVENSDMLAAMLVRKAWLERHQRWSDAMIARLKPLRHQSAIRPVLAAIVELALATNGDLLACHERLAKLTHLLPAQGAH